MAVTVDVFPLLFSEFLESSGIAMKKVMCPEYGRNIPEFALPQES